MSHVLLQVINLSKTYKDKNYWFNRKCVAALDPVSFDIMAHKTLAIVGETGSGKSTLARLLVGAELPTTGHIRLNGETFTPGDFKQRCQHVRMIFQDSAASLNPGLTIGEMLDDCLQYNTELDASERAEKIDATLSKVGLLIDHKHYYPHMFSVGQLQRVASSRALILDPKVIVLDEAVSSLDPSIRAQIVNLLLKLQRDTGLTYVMITHHLSLVRHISDYVVVLDKGEVVEYGPTEDVFQNPQSKVTQRLLSC